MDVWLPVQTCAVYVSYIVRHNMQLVRTEICSGYKEQDISL